MKKLIITAVFLVAVIPAFAQGIVDFSYFCWTINHDTNNGGTVVNTNQFTVTDGATNENRSAWFQHPLYVGGFQASFTYQDFGGGGAEGIAFVVQNDPNGTNALGFDGQGLGYCGITNSVALLLNLSSNAPGGASGWMLASNGVGIEDFSGEPSGLAYQSTAPLDLTAGNPVNVNISYDGATLWLSLTDIVSSAAFQTNIPMNIPSLVGSNTALVGITGSDGAAASTQTVSNFTYVPLPTLSNGGTNGTNATFVWPASIIGYSLQSKANLGSAHWQADASPVIQTNGWNQAIVSPTTGQYFYRLVTTTARRPTIGPITATHSIHFSGYSIVDSYNSQDPNYSTNGLYTSVRRTDHACVLTLSTNPGSISMYPGSSVYGKVVTGPGGTMTIDFGGSVSVGDMAWIAGGNLGFEPGHFASNAAVQIIDVNVPNTAGWNTVLSGGQLGGTNYTYLLSSGNYNIASLSMSTSNTMAVSGNVNLYISGNVSLTSGSYIYIAPGSSLTLYLGGDEVFGGRGIVNATGLATNCSIYGLATCANVKFTGGGAFIGTVYVPDGDLSFAGGTSISGALTANSITLGGGVQVHYDESLAPPSYGW